MTRKQSQLRAYFAGIFDGEGTVGIYNTNGKTQKDRGWQSYRMSVNIRMTEPLAVALMKREFPEAYFYKIKEKEGYRDSYRFSVEQWKAERFLKEIKPFVLVKWPQVKVALAFLAHCRRFQYHKTGTGLAKPEEYYRRSQRLAEIMKALKIPNPQGVNSVDVLVQHGLYEYRAKPEEVDEDAKYLRGLLESVETSVDASTSYKTMSAPEKDIVQN